MDSRLFWKFHISELSKKLIRAIGLLYKICAYSPKPIMISLYFAIFHSHLTYGLPVWGFANQGLLNNIAIMKEINILSLIDQRHLQVSSLMWDLDHNSLPPTLSSYFKKCEDIHQHNTRHAANGKLQIKKNNTIKYGVNSFQVQGSLTLNSLKDLDIYKNAISKKSFLSNLKKSLINNY